MGRSKGFRIRVYPENRRQHPTLAALLAALCFLALFHGLIGCGGADSDPHWQKIEQRGNLRVGLDPNWVPFEYVNGNGQLVGFDVELAQALTDRMGLGVHFDASLSFDGLFDALVADRVDAVISAVVADPARTREFAFSRPYFDAGQVIVVDERRTDIMEMTDLSHSVLAVELGSEGDTVARRSARRLIGLKLLHLDSADLALTAVAEGAADAALIDRATALILLKRRRTGTPSAQQGSRTPEQLEIRGKPITAEQYAVVVPQTSTGLLAAINEALRALGKDGTLGRLERKWLGP
jgi:polar amino acid transport system substrate-binding protein